MRMWRVRRLLVVVALLCGVVTVLLAKLEFISLWGPNISISDLKTDLPCSEKNNLNFRCWIPSSMYIPGDTFNEAIKEKANDKKVIYLISVDSGYVDMAVNLYESSLQRLEIMNFLYVCSDQEAAQILHQHGIQCYLYEQTKLTGNLANGYLEGDFAKKTHIKTKIVLGALLLGYTVILSDVDIVYFKDPVSSFTCGACDMEIQSDYMEANSGFYIAYPTEGSILFHKMALAHAMMNVDDLTSQQMTFNDALAKLDKIPKRLIYSILDPNLFPCGFYYYEVGRRMFADDNPCVTCVLVHNNWMVSKAAKIYRFKENLQWHVDKDQYYSDPNRKYIIYENILDFGSDTLYYELAALKNALFIGYLSNRTVILPTFSCGSCQYEACQTSSKRCALNTHLQISVFDQYLAPFYREHVFLQHKKVPHFVKTSLSPDLVIQTDAIKESRGPLVKLSDSHIIFSAKDSSVGVQPQEILRWFEENDLTKYSVLKFKMLYGVFHLQPKQYSDAYSNFDINLTKGFIPLNDYRQYPRSFLQQIWQSLSLPFLRHKV